MRSPAQAIGSDNPDVASLPVPRAASRQTDTGAPNGGCARTVADDFGARHDALAEHFSHEEILEIIGIVINMNVWTRLKLAEGASPGLAEQAMS